MIRESICKKTLCFRSRPNTSQWISTRSQFKRDLVEAIRQSNELFPKSIKEFSPSMLAVASGITKSVEILLQALCNQNQQASPPYIYQSPQHIHLQTQHSLIHFPQSQKGNTISAIFIFKCTILFQVYQISHIAKEENLQL